MRRVFAVPAAIAVLTAAGLMSALLVEGIGPAISWVTLMVPLLILARYVGRFAMRRR